MNRLLISTAIAGILAMAVSAGSGLALAQDRGDDHRGDRGKPAAAAPAARAPAPAQEARPPIGGRDGHDFTPPPAPAARNTPPGQPASRDAMRGPDNRGADNRGGYRGPAPGAAMRGPGPSTAMRGPARDFGSFHRNFNAPQHFHAATYRRPNGWYAHRWTYGEFLPSLFWAPDYWLNDYIDFGLAPPPPGTVWVRDGDDALLIDRYTGEIIQVEYSVFF